MLFMKQITLYLGFDSNYQAEGLCLGAKKRNFKLEIHLLSMCVGMCISTCACMFLKTLFNHVCVNCFNNLAQIDCAANSHLVSNQF